MFALSTLLLVINHCFLELLLCYTMLINLKLILMQVSDANILKPKGMLCNVTLNLKLKYT